MAFRQRGWLLGAALSLIALGCSDETTTKDVPSPSPSPSSSSTSSPPARAPLSATQKIALAELETATKTTWRVEQNTRLATPSLLAPKVRAESPRLLTGVMTKSASVRRTIDFLHANKDLFRMRDPAAELTPRAAADVTTRPLDRSDALEADELQMTHVRLAQVERGVPVVGGELYAHYDGEGRLTAIQGHYVPELASLSVDPAVSADAARRVALADAEALSRVSTSLDTLAVKAAKPAPAQLSASTPRLIVFAMGREATPSLAWEMTVREDAGRARQWLVTIDAQTGLVIDRIDAIESLKGSGVGVKGDTKPIEYLNDNGTLLLSDESRPAIIRTFDLLNGSDLTKAVLISSNTPTAWDTEGPGRGSGVDAHANMGVVYDFYKTTLGRKSWNDKDELIQNVVHDGVEPDNASYNQVDNIMRFGDGKDVFLPLAGALDVVAHEYTHAVTFNTSALRYETQSGALNEAMSDIFGAIVEHAIKPDPVNNWLIAEGFVKDDKSLRDMVTPSSAKLTAQPSHMKELVNTQQDNGGVHINSGIINKAAHLMTVGGTHPVSNVTVTNPIGFDKLAKVFYRANQRYLIASSDFALAAKATMEAATDLKLAQADLDTIDCAWKAVGVVQGECAAAAAKPQSRAGGDDPSSGGGKSGAPSGDLSDETNSGGTKGDGKTAAKNADKDHDATTQRVSSGCSVALGPSEPSSSPLAGLLLSALFFTVHVARRRKNERQV